MKWVCVERVCMIPQCLICLSAVTCICIHVSETASLGRDAVNSLLCLFVGEMCRSSSFYHLVYICTWYRAALRAKLAAAGDTVHVACEPLQRMFLVDVLYLGFGLGS
jgi:hypothetical protein